MDSEILAELKKINLQLAQIVQSLNTTPPVATNPGKAGVRDIASEVQAKIADARRRAENSMGVPSTGFPTGFGAE
jgi:hypothetical protein